MDQANLLNVCESEVLENLLWELKKKTDIQLQFLSIPSLEGEIIEEYSIKVTDQWKLGTEKEDKGLLLLIAKNDRKIRIEVGQGLEGDIPDMRAMKIIDEMGVYFRNSNFYGGVFHAFSRIIKLSAPEFSASGNYTSSPECSGFASQGYGASSFNNDFDPFILIFFILLLLFIFYISSRLRSDKTRDFRSRRRNPFDDHWGSGGGFGGFGGGSGGFGGGGWSGGGGGFSGGGASGGW